MSTRQYARLLSSWFTAIGLDPSMFGTHSLRRTKLESTVRYLCVEVDDALAFAEQVDV
jgi:3',5'-cyclic AMP phosphodiesterase CpdA